MWLLTCAAFHQVQAQPANDNVCSATTIIVDGPAQVVNVAMATVETGEQAIAPPFSTDPNCTGENWCDGTTGGGSLIENSVWFNFVAPASGAILIDVCMSDYDNQMAVYSVGNCADFNSFALLRAREDEVGCGTGAGTNFATTISMECLVPGSTYYVLIDGWQAASGNVNISITSQSPASAGASIDSLLVTNPSCALVDNGALSVEASGVLPLSYLWSTGDTTTSIDSLAPGTYGVTVTDFCGTTATGMHVLVANAPIPVVIDSAYLTHPTYCGSDTILGQILLELNPAGGPFDFTWSNGDSTGLIVNLSDGVYAVTISNEAACSQLVETFVLGISAGADQFTCGFPVELGNSIPTGATISSITYSTDQSISAGIVACAGGGFVAQNSWYRAFDLAGDFGLSGSVDIEGVEVFLSTVNAGPGGNGAQPVSFALHSATAMDLNTATLTELQRINVQLPDINGITPFIIPFDLSVAAATFLAVEITVPGPSGDGHQFRLGINNTVTTQTTYLSSIDCGIPIPTDVTSIGGGFPHYLVMNVLVNNGGVPAVYDWQDPNQLLSDSTIANPTTTTPGTYYLSVTECGNTYFDTVMVAVGSECSPACASPITSFPWNEDFENFVLCGAGNCGVNCQAAVANGWTQATYDDQDWSIHAGSTSSFGTGPSDGFEGSQYVYTEASSGCNNQMLVLVSPCFDLASLSQPELSFFYHMYGVDMGSLSADITEDNGVTWNTVWTRSGQAQMSETDPWIPAYIDLSAYSGIISFRFVGETGPGFGSDMAVDGVRVGELSCQLPQGLTLSMVDSTSAEVLISSSQMPIEWQIEIINLDLGESFDGSIDSVSTDTILNFTNLQPGTFYSAQVRASCAVNEQSIWFSIDFLTSCLTAAVAGDSVGAAINIGSELVPFTTIGSTFCATNQYIARAGKDIFYKFNTGSYAGEAHFSTCSDITNFDTYLYLLDSAQVLLASNDDAIGGCNYTLNGPNRFSVLEYTLTANTDYFVVIDGFSASSEGIYSFSVAPICDSIYTTFPIVEDFSSFTSCSGITCGLDCPTPNDWLQDSLYDSEDWYIQSNNTTSVETGPSNHFGPEDLNGQYAYREVSGGCEVQSTNFISPCLDLSALANPELSFFYHMYGSDIGQLDVAVSTDYGARWVNLWSQVGEVQHASTEVWKPAYVDLTAYPFATNIRFRASGGTSFHGDIAIDAIRIDEPTSCHTPYNLQANEVKLDSALLSWSSDPLSGNYNIQINVDQIDTFDVNRIDYTASDTFIWLQGLQPGTYYNIFVRSSCAPGDSSFWNGPFRFTTLCDIPGDSISVAIDIPSLPYMDIGRTDECFTDQSSIYIGTADVFYKFTSSSVADSIYINTCFDTTNYDIYIHLLDAAGNLIVSNDDSDCPINGLYSRILHDIDPNTTYHILLDGLGEGIYGLEVIEITSCPPSLHVSGSPASGLYRAADSITSDAMIQTGRVVDFRAGQSIELQANFEVKLNGEFEMSIEDCP
jgi:hypothetical protein